MNLISEKSEVSIFSALRSETEAVDNTLPFRWKYHVVSSNLALAGKLRKKFWWFVLDAFEYSDSFYSPQTAQKLSNFLEEIKPKIVIIEEIWMYRYLDVIKKANCKIILDNHNVELEVSKIQNLMRRPPGFYYKARGYRRHFQVKEIERRLLKESDQVWVCSDIDAEELRKIYRLSEKDIRIIPNGINTESYIRPEPHPYKVPRDAKYQDIYVLYTGSYDYPPNAWAAKRLITKILPRLVKEDPRIKLLLVGRKPDNFMQESADSDPRVIVTGTVDDVIPYYHAAHVMAVPLVHGSGTRLKVLEAFAAGCPVVGTPKALEGLAVEHEQNALIALHDRDIADNILRVIREPALKETLCANALDLVEKFYSWDAARPLIHAALHDLLH